MLDITNSYPVLLNDGFIFFGKLGERHIELAHRLNIELDETFMSGRFENKNELFLYGDKKIYNECASRLFDKVIYENVK